MATTEFQISTYMRARLETWESDVSTANNTSVVHARIVIWRTNTWSGQTYSSSVRRIISIDGTTVCDWTGEISHYKSYGEIEVASGSKTVTHNNDGSKSVGVSASLQDNVGSYFTGSGSLTMGLTTIARASQPSINTWPDNSPNFNIGDTITIHMNRKSSSFTHTVKINYGSTSYTIATNVGDNCTLNTSNIASQLYAQMPAATSYSNTISVTTYNGSTNIGTKTCAYTAKAVEANAKPTFSNFTYQDTNSTITAITGNNQYLVQGKSNLRVIISTANKATAKYSASILNYNASISGLSASADYTTSALNIDFSSNAFTAGTQTLAVKATDSRGYSTSVSKDVTVLSYASPVINATATRLNNFENQTTLVIKGSYSPLTISGTAKNTVLSVEYRYKKQSTSTWGDWTAMTGLSPTSAGAYTTTNKVLDLDNSSAYDFEVRVTDRLETITTTLVVSVGIPIFRIGTDGFVYNNEQPLMPSHVGQIIMSTTLNTAAKVKAIYGGTWVAWGAGRVPVGVGSNGTTNYSSANATGGSEKHRHDFCIGMHAFYGALVDDDWVQGVNGSGAYSYSQGTFSKSLNWSGSASTKRNNSLGTSMTSYSETCRRSYGDTDTGDSRQPYITCYMWRRTA